MKETDLTLEKVAEENVSAYAAYDTSLGYEDGSYEETFASPDLFWTYYRLMVAVRS